MIPLKEVIGPIKKPIELREVEPTKAQSDDLARIYLQVVRLWRDQAKIIVDGFNPPPVGIVSDSVEETESEISEAEVIATALLALLLLRVKEWSDRLYAWHLRKWVSMVLSKTGVDLSAFLSSSAARAEIQASLAWNASLVRNLSDEMRDKISNAVWSSWKAGDTKEELARRLDHILKLGRKRALRIAIDQTNKLSSDLDRARMIELGINDWIWVHNKNPNPRHFHVERDGKAFNWTNRRPPDLPGELPFCGCKARAVIK